MTSLIKGRLPGCPPRSVGIDKKACHEKSIPRSFRQSDMQNPSARREPQPVGSAVAIRDPYFIFTVTGVTLCGVAPSRTQDFQSSRFAV